MDISKLKIAYKWMTSDFRDFFTGECQFHYGWNIANNLIGFWVTAKRPSSHNNYFLIVGEKNYPNSQSICMQIKYNCKPKIFGGEDYWFTVNKFFMAEKAPVKTGLIPLFWNGNSWSLDKKE